jgi:SagB-type dehydrogenase family enzyme
LDDGGLPQLILVLTARFGRLSWKYEGNAYALLLQEVGVVYQTMYLVATAMGLAPCAVGGGDAADFAHLIGTDPLEEASVGAFVLGRRA